jgi:putative transposase
VTRNARGDLEDGFFHAYSRGVYRQTIFRDEVDYEAFLWLLDRTERRFGWRVFAACLMPTHFHVVLEATVKSLSAGMHRLKGLYAQRFNRRHDRYGHVFASRFDARVIENASYFAIAYNYTLENPVRAGECEHVDEWPFSIRRPFPDF